MNLTKEFQCSARMTGNSFGPSFPRLYPSRGQLDETLEVIRCWSLLSAGVPDLFPRFMGLPVIAVVEKLDAPQVLFVPNGIFRREGLTLLGDLTEAVPGWVAERVGEPAGDIGIRGKRALRK